MSLDHGYLNVPLSKRGDIDAQIDRYNTSVALSRREAHAARLQEGRAQKVRIAELLKALPDERALALAAPLGKRTAAAARKALASEANENMKLWLVALEREAAR